MTSLPPGDKAIIQKLEAEILQYKKNEEDYRLLFDRAPIAYQSLDNKGCFFAVNQAWLDTFGYSREEVIGQPFENFLPQEWKNHFKENFPRFKSVGEILGVEFSMIKKDRNPVKVSFNGKIGLNVDGSFKQTHCIILDITKERQTEERVRRQDATLQSILAATPTAIGVVHNRVFSWVNDKMLDMLGYSREELINHSARIVYPSDEEFERAGKIKYAKILEKNLGMVDTVWMRKDGTLMDVHLQSAPLTPGDLSTGVTFTALDITDRKKAEEDKRKMELQIQHVQKLESLGVLAGGIAHDFNNILMTILGNADLAVSDLSPASPAYINLIEIEKASRRAADLCKQMLAYSGHGKFISQPLDLSTVISEMNHMLEVSISKHVVLKYQLTENLPAVLGDANQINQIIMNLVVNSSEAIEKNSGVVSISTGAMECDRKYLTETYLDDNLPEGIYCYIEIADTGCGMEKDIIAKFFDPFFSTKFAGRGLGMSAVLGIVRGHKGALKVYSEPRRGTTIKVLFPALEDSVPATKNNEDLEIVKWRGHGTVLLVDDEETIRTLGKKMLERIGFSVLVAKDGRDAVNVYKQFESEIDCVLTDLTMPHMDGEVAFRELRKINRNVRVILSSGYNEQDVTEKFVGKGLAGFIQKPYTLALLREAMQKIFQNQE